MRSDYALYVVAIIFFILAAVVLAAHYAGYPLMPSEISIIPTAVLVVLGLIFAGAGYMVRSEEVMPTPSPHPPSPEPSAPSPKMKSTPAIEITEVKGIGPKRAEELKALGINTAQDLAKTGATTIAAKTGLSPRIARKWVREAKRLIKEVA